MQSWKLTENGNLLRIEPVSLRAMEGTAFSWSHLLYGKLGPLQTCVFYFPSRFDTGTDKSVIEALHHFGKNTGPTTAVAIWDTRDPHLQAALGLFNLTTVPALVLATGLQVRGMQPRGPAQTPLYSITFTDSALLSDEGRLQSAVNAAHEILMRCDPAEIASYIRAQTPNRILAAVSRVAKMIRDELLKWKPKFSLPGGISIQVG